MANRTKCEKRSLNVVLMFALLVLAASSCSGPPADADSTVDVGSPPATVALTETPTLPLATPVGRETPGTPAGSPPTTTPAIPPTIDPTQAPLESIPPIPHDETTRTSPAPIGTTVTFPGGLELNITDVIYPAAAFLADNVAGADFQQRLAAEAAAGRSSLVVEWVAACPVKTGVQRD